MKLAFPQQAAGHKAVECKMIRGRVLATYSGATTQRFCLSSLGLALTLWPEAQRCLFFSYSLHFFPFKPAHAVLFRVICEHFEETHAFAVSTTLFRYITTVHGHATTERTTLLSSLLHLAWSSKQKTGRSKRGRAILKHPQLKTLARVFKMAILSWRAAKTDTTMAFDSGKKGAGDFVLRNIT